MKEFEKAKEVVCTYCKEVNETDCYHCEKCRVQHLWYDKIDKAKELKLTMDKRFSELKAALFDWGVDYIEEFLGYEIDSDWEKDTIESEMNDAYEEMDEERLEEFYEKFNIK